MFYYSPEQTLYLYNTTNSTVFNTIILKSEGDGIHIVISQNVIIRNVTVQESLRFGLCAHMSVNTSFQNVTVLNSDVSIFIASTTNATVTNTIVDTSRVSGMCITNSNNTIVKDTVVKNTKTEEITFNKYIPYLNTTVFIYYGLSVSSSTGTVISNTTIEAVQWGVLIFRAAYISLSHTTVNSTTGLFIVLSNNTQVYNSDLAAGIGLEGNVQRVMVIKSSNVTFNTVSLSGFSGPLHTSIPYLPAVIGLETATDVVMSECTFANNYISALRVTNLNLVFSGNIIFRNNHAIKGGAIIVSQQSTLNLAPNANVIFENNSASYGGAIYVNGDEKQVIYEETLASGRTIVGPKPQPCFLTSEKSQKSLVFINNTALYGGDVLYEGDLEGAYTNESSDEQCITFFKTISSMTPHENQLSLITSEPSRACHCSSRYRPDCYMLSKTLSVYPGQTTNIPAVRVGQGLGTVAGSVFADFLDDVYQPSLGTLQDAQQVFQHQCNNLSYTIFAQQDDVEVVLVLTASKRKAPHMTNKTASQAIEIYNRHHSEDYPFEFLQMPIYVHITLLPCPPGFKLVGNPARCNCIEMLQTLPEVTCSIQHQTVTRSGLVWVGSAKGDNETTVIMAADYCPLRYCTSDSVNVSLQQSDTQCNYGHSGILCGGCPPNLSTVLGSAQCLPCSNKYLALLIPFALAGFLLVFFIKVFDMTISSGTIHGLIFYANIIKVNEAIFLPGGDHERTPLSVFISWVNLDLGIQTCFFNGLTAYLKTWLQFVFPFYIWIIAFAIIIAAKHSRRISKVMGNNSVPVLATLFLLSYAKLLRTVITALSYSVVKHPHGQRYVWSAEGNIDYLGSQHVPLFAAAVAVLVFLYLPYTLLLLMGQWLHKCQARPVICFMVKMKPFLNAHFGCLKEKHRYWFGILLLIRACILLLSTLIPVSSTPVVTF